MEGAIGPLLVPFVGAGLGALGIGAGTPLIISGAMAGLTVGAAAVAEAVSSAVVLGAAVGASLLVNRAKKSVTTSTLTINQALPNRFIDCGRVKTGGATVYYAAPGVYLYVVKVLSCTRIDAIERLNMSDYYTEDAAINTGAPTVRVPGPWFAYLVAETRLGADDQPALSLPQAGGQWTSDHRLRGMACFAVAYAQAAEKDQAKIYPNGAPNGTAVIRGAMLPDCRNPAHDLADPGTWDYGETGGRVLLRYCLDQDGWGLSPDDLHIETWSQALTDCEDGVLDAYGHLEMRYRAWGRYSTGNERKSTVEDMLAAMGGTLLEQPDGTIGLFVGKHREPTVTITSDQIIEKQYERFPDALSRVDGVKSRIVWEGAGWEEQECPTIYSGEDTYGAAPDVDDLPLSWCPSPYQAQRLCKAALRQKRPEWTLTIKTWLHGLRCYGEPVVRLVIPELGIDGTFEITAPPALDVGTMTVTLSVRSYASDTWLMDPSEMSAMGEVGSSGDSYSVPAPEGMAAAVSGLAVTVTWDAVAGEEAYTNEAQRRTHDDGEDDETGWVDITDVTTGAAVFDAPATGTYDVRARRISTRGTASDWAVLEEIEVA